jgi:hypothetical protein
MSRIMDLAYMATLAVIWAVALVAMGFIGKVAWFLLNLGWGVL